MKKKTSESARTAERWARLRFSVVGQLLASPPPHGELKREFEKLSKKPWQHPITGESLTVAASTIETWYYAARDESANPVAVLERKTRKDKGHSRAISAEVGPLLKSQYHAHPSWSYKLHADNLRAVIARRPELGKAPSVPSVRRYMKRQGLLKRRKRPSGAEEKSFEGRETRSYEAEYVHGLWHLDFHHGSRKVLTPTGQYEKPIALAIIDDRSRLACHVQWYLDEKTASLVHGLSQAIQKRGLPRELMTDNGAAMTAAETTEGLFRLSVTHRTTLPYSPHQNGKQEVFWARLEGRLIAMLEGCQDLSLEKLNRATQAWVELEYHKEKHRETGEAPVQRCLAGPDVGRPSPTSEQLRWAFRQEVTRTQRRSDGTISLEGVRFEIPSRYRVFERVRVHFASWDKRHVHLVDPDTGALLCPIYPLDRARNADGHRRTVETQTSEETPAAQGLAPLLAQQLELYESSGLPFGYLPTESEE